MGNIAVRTALILWPLTSFILSLAEIYYDRGQQWDVRNYLNGLKAYRAGLNPYRDSAFIYPPVYLPLMNWLTRAYSYDQVFVGMLVVKLVSFLTLLYVWKRWFLSRVPMPIFLPVVWLGLYSSCAIDFYAGNISVMETLTLFVGFTAVLTGHLLAAAGLIALASTAKLTPLVFLGVLLTRPGGGRAFGLGVALFAFYAGLNYGFNPEFARTFLSEAWTRTAEAKMINPSSLAFVRDALPPGFEAAAPALWLVYVITIGVLSWRARPGWLRGNPRETILFLILVYVITAPRMKDYAYMIALPSLLYVAYNYRPRRPEWLVAFPLLLTIKSRAPLLFEAPAVLLWNYYPLGVCLVFWSLIVTYAPDQNGGTAQSENLNVKDGVRVSATTVTALSGPV